MLSLLPHGMVSKQIEYKASEYGIKTILADESFTSGVDSLKDIAFNKEITHLKQGYIGDGVKVFGKLASSPESVRVYGQIGGRKVW